MTKADPAMTKGLPDVIGPKTYPFEPNGKDVQIDFIEEIGKGLHGVVWKVKISNNIYALKIFNWRRIWAVGHYATFGVKVTWEEEDAYFSPFHNECRAYGRLKEFNCEDLAYKCFGYIELQKPDFDFIKETYNNFETDEDQEVWGYEPDEPFCLEEPLRALVKEFVEIPYLLPLDGEIARTMNPKMAPKAVRNLKLIHRLGICELDINRSNYIHGKFLDFSCAMTAPHPYLSRKYGDDFPPLNEPRVDAMWLDAAIDDWNEFYPENKIWISCENTNYRYRLRKRSRKPFRWSAQPADFDYDKMRKEFERKGKAKLMKH
ncbi:kinetochore Sim4 complex subunit FTA2-domain-containing protein [Xylariaceae sp. FL1272]|nr:kinetochore Sim4 complex subunit FTA2-domain-containing protein [Xylariaceae sp. FL1272]